MAGIVILAVLGRAYGIQNARIVELGRRTNFAQVRVEGRVTDEIRFHSADENGRSQSLEFEVDDGTGVIRVRCYDDACREMQAADHIPGRGDRVSLIGNYQYKARRQFLILSSPADLTIERETPAIVLPLARVARADQSGLKESQRVRVTGRLRSATDSLYETTWWLEDPAGATLPVTLSKGVLEASGEEEADRIRALAAGDFVTCSGTLEWKKGRAASFWQIVPAGPDDFQTADEPTWKRDNGGN